MKPTFRCETKKAIDELADELTLPNDLSMQDWAYEVSKPHDIDKYISHYYLLTDEDKKFVLKEMILQALVNQSDEQQLLNCWKVINPILMNDFRIQDYTIHYWKNLTDDKFDNCKTLSPLLGQLWKTKTSDYEIR